MFEPQVFLEDVYRAAFEAADARVFNRETTVEIAKKDDPICVWAQSGKDHQFVQTLDESDYPPVTFAVQLSVRVPRIFTGRVFRQLNAFENALGAAIARSRTVGQFFSDEDEDTQDRGRRIREFEFSVNDVIKETVDDD